MLDSNQRGNGRLGLILTLGVTAAAVFAAVRYIPVRVAAYEFHDEMREEARYGATRGLQSTVTKNLLEKADELDIPLNRKKLSVRKTKSEIVIKASYEQEIDFKVWKYTYKFKAEERAPLF